MTLATAAATDRRVPFDEAAEQHVLGCLLIDRDAIFKIADLLRVDDFYLARHQRVYAAAQALLERRERIDPITMGQETSIATTRTFPFVRVSLVSSSAGINYVHVVTDNGANTLAGIRMDGSYRMHLDGTPVGQMAGISTFSQYTTVSTMSAIPCPDDIPLDVACVIGCSVQTGVGAVLNTARSTISGAPTASATPSFPASW